MKVKVLHCERCKHEWIRSRQRDHDPAVCPKCKSRLWRTPKDKKEVKEELVMDWDGMMDYCNQTEREE